jgi:dienelactone hydrolase
MTSRLWFGAACSIVLLSTQPPDRLPFYSDKLDLLYYLDEQGDRVSVRSAADWDKRRMHIRAGFQLVAGPHAPKPEGTPLDVQVLEEVTLPKVIRRRITFQAEPGDRVPAYLLIPRAVTDRCPAMLCLHQTTRIGKAEPAGVGGQTELHYALEWAERGYVTLAPDYPGFGDYRADPYALGYASATMKGIANHRRAIDLLASLPQVDDRRIGCIGHSLGGHNALFVALFEPRVGAVVTSCGFTSFARYYGGDLTGWTHKGYMPRIASVFNKAPSRMPFDFPEVLAAVAPRAVFINAPTGDLNFAVAGVRECVAAARPIFALLGAAKKLEVHYPNAGHSFPAAVRRAAIDFTDRALAPLPTGDPSR